MKPRIYVETSVRGYETPTPSVIDQEAMTGRLHK
jgi:hypothetical protein